MWRVLGSVLVGALVASGCASSSSGPTDTGGDHGDVEEDGDGIGDVDAGDGEVGDVRDVGDGADAARAKHTVISLTAGGGAVTSPNYRLQLSVGAPQPMGAGASGTRDVRLGPGAVQNQ